MCTLSNYYYSLELVDTEFTQHDYLVMEQMVQGFQPNPSSQQYCIGSPGLDLDPSHLQHPSPAPLVDELEPLPFVNEPHLSSLGSLANNFISLFECPAKNVSADMQKQKRVVDVYKQVVKTKKRCFVCREVGCAGVVRRVYCPVMKTR